jgi:hypothetical protein
LGISRLRVKTVSILSMSSGRSLFWFLPSREFAVGVDEQHLVALGGGRLVQHQDAGGDAGAVEEVAAAGR